MRSASACRPARKALEDGDQNLGEGEAGHGARRTALEFLQQEHPAQPAENGKFVGAIQDRADLLHQRRVFHLEMANVRDTLRQGRDQDPPT